MLKQGNCMRDIFRGWRRKTGCVLLLVACAAMVAWLRSYLVDTDSFTVATNRQIYSHNGSVSWNIIYPGVVTPDLWQFHAAITGGEELEVVVPKFNWRWEVCGFVGSEMSMYGQRIVQYWVPYWSIATPLALIAAVLILWPRWQSKDSDMSPIA